jgi:hypothetical protein
LRRQEKVSMTITDAAELLAMDAAARRLSPRTLVFYRERARAITRIVGDKRGSTS